MRTSTRLLLPTILVWACVLSRIASAQITTPTQATRDSSLHPHPEAQSISFEIAKPEPAKPTDTSKRVSAPAQGSASHRLPPSILAELRRSERGRALIFRDTLRGTDLARSHLNDSVERQYSDSALAIVDTAVSLSHKEWLDSEMVEIPEISRFGSKIHFEYPSSIMTETDLTPVPFDSTLLSGMNPVTRENLPFFDQSPIPMPLGPPKPMEGFVEAGGGNIYQPRASAWFEDAVSSRTSVSAFVNFRNLSGTPIHSFFLGNASVDADVGADPAKEAYRSSNLRFTLGYASKSLVGVGDSVFKLTSFDHTLAVFDASLHYTADASEQFHFAANVADHEWSDHAIGTLTESSQDVDLSAQYNLLDPELQLVGNAGFAEALATSSKDKPLIGVSPAINDEYVSLIVGNKRGQGMEWHLGATLFNGYSRGYNTAEIRPIIRLRIPIGGDWEIGANTDPQICLTTWRSLTETNPFLARYESQMADVGSTPRFVVMDQINLTAFVNYSQSPDNFFHLEGQFITRTHEPLFSMFRTFDSTFRPFAGSLNYFGVESYHDVRHINVAASGSFTLFARDVVTASLALMKYDMLNTVGEILFEPTMKANVAYHCNSLSDIVFPAIEFRSIARGLDQTINLLNLEARVVLNYQLNLNVRAENILGSASDFWPGYPEYPRSIWASVRYRFE